MKINLINIICSFIDYWPTGQPNTPLSLSRAGASAVTGGAQHVAGPLAGAQGAPVVPQGTLQQPTQQAQPLPPMGISLSQTGELQNEHNIFQYKLHYLDC